MPYYIITHPKSYDCNAELFETLGQAKKALAEDWYKDEPSAVLVASVDVTPPAQYKIKLVITLTCDEYSFAPWQLEKAESIPLLPFPGLVYKDMGEILDVTWTGKHIICGLPDRHFHTTQQMDEVRRMFEEGGWKAEARF